MLESARDYWEYYKSRILSNHPDGYAVISGRNGFDNRFKIYRTLTDLKRDFPDYCLGRSKKNTEIIVSLSDEIWKESPKRTSRVIFSTRNYRWSATA